MAGKVVVASRVGGIPEVVGEDGILVPPGDPVALAADRPRAARAAHEVGGAAQARGVGRILASLFPTLRLVFYTHTHTHR